VAALAAQRQEELEGLEAELMIRTRGARDGNSVACMGAYRPDSALRVYVFTDGEDTDSPPPFRGMGGMNALQQSLLSKGFRVEWHVIVVSSGGSRHLIPFMLSNCATTTAAVAVVVVVVVPTI
jgi:hypothetical protein